MMFLLSIDMTMEALEIVEDCNRDFYSDYRECLDVLQKLVRTGVCFVGGCYITMLSY